MKRTLFILCLSLLLIHQNGSAYHDFGEEIVYGVKSDFHFTENKGQLISSVKYHCKLHIGDIFFKDNQFSFDLFSADELDKVHDLRHNHLGDSSSSFVFNKHI